MKKIALMTWFSWHNYGTALQSVALSSIIRRLGYKVDVVNYKPKTRAATQQSSVSKWIIKKIIDRTHPTSGKQIINYKRDFAFDSFLNSHLSFTKECQTFSELESLNNVYDVFVCGSDQIWSPLVFDDKYFLSFVFSDFKKVAYAPSIGVRTIENTDIKLKMQSLISSFPHLSVREKDGANIIKEITGKDAKVVVDPTLLLTRNEWDDVISELKNPFSIKGKYMICYFLGENKKYYKSSRTIAKRLGLPLFFIPSSEKQLHHEGSVPINVGPTEFISLIKNASFVCTDSFHGLVFSLIYNKPFVVYKRFSNNSKENQNSRISSLLSIIKSQDRFIDPDYKRIDKLINNPNYQSINSAISIHRSASMEYLTNSIEEACNSQNCIQEYTISTLCCGCGACKAVCKSNAITIKRDLDGFFHYYLDSKKCIKCQNCRTVCPFNTIGLQSLLNARSLYSFEGNPEQIYGSSSGGAAYSIASYLFMNDYKIIGSVYNSNKNEAEHIIVEEYKDLEMLKGSKYIQSYTAEVFNEIIERATNSLLCFFGTPCQCAGLDKLLRKSKKRENVVLVDLICHGVPSYYLFNKYLFETEKKYGINNNPKVFFRSPKGLWRKRSIEITDGKTIFIKNEVKDDFYAFFRRGLCDMKTCYDCPYRENSSADIRLGDYWGNRFANKKTGVSMVIAITEKGDSIIESIKRNKNNTIHSYPIEDYWTVQHPYNTSMPVFRDRLINELKTNKQLSELRKDYCRVADFREMIERVINKVK